MNINLKRLDLAYINLSSYPNRNQSMINMLNYYGLRFSRIEGVSENGGYGVPQAHLKALNSKANLILEDDCVPYEYREEFVVPDNADVVFLGISSGTTKSFFPKYKRISEEIYRLYDMTGLHAVLYLTEDGKQWLRDAHDRSVREGIAMDICTAQSLVNISAYGLNRPIWYQKDIKDITGITLKEGLGFDDYHGGGFEDYRRPLEYPSQL